MSMSARLAPCDVEERVSAVYTVHMCLRICILHTLHMFNNWKRKEQFNTYIRKIIGIKCQTFLSRVECHRGVLLDFLGP